MLVVADNAHSAAQVRPLLPGTGEHRLLATTRGGLHSLAGAHHLDLDVLDPADSLALLAFALKAADPQDTRADDVVELSRLSELCGHLPLALEIAGAQLARKPRLSPSTLSERLVKAVSRVDKLKDHGPHAEPTRVLRAVFDTSRDQLTPEEVRVFLLVTAAPGPTTSTVSAAVLIGLVGDEVQELQAAHLLTQPAHDLLTDHATTCLASRRCESRSATIAPPALSRNRQAEGRFDESIHAPTVASPEESSHDQPVIDSPM